MTDRELDAALHEALTGKTVVWTRWLGTALPVIQIASKDEPDAVPMTVDPSMVVPRYTEFWHEMRVVISAMKERGWYWRATDGFGAKYVGHDATAGFGRPGTTPADYVVADDSLPRATVLAALAALGRPVAGVEYGGWLGSGLPRVTPE